MLASLQLSLPVTFNCNSGEMRMSFGAVKTKYKCGSNACVQRFNNDGLPKQTMEQAVEACDCRQYSCVHMVWFVSSIL